MKIWILSNAYKPEKGGLVSYCRYLALCAKKKDKKVEIVVSNLKNKQLEAKEVLEGINISRIDYSGIPLILSIFTPIIFYLKTLYYIKNSKIDSEDIVISRYYSFALALEKSCKTKKHIFIAPLVAPELHKISVKKAKGIKKIYYYIILPQIYLLDKLAMRKSRNLATLSKSKREEIAKYYNIDSKKVCVLPPGIDYERFRIATFKEKSDLRKVWNYDSDDKIMVCVSRLSSEKNLEILINAVDNIYDKKIKLIFIGDGDQKRVLQKICSSKKLENRIRFLGFKENVEDFYKMSDVFILPSKYEGFGHVYLEALASGLPCIAARNNPPESITVSEEIITNEKLGIIVNYNSLEEIVQAISESFKNSEKYKFDRRNHVIKNYSWETHLEMIERILS